MTNHSGTSGTNGSAVEHDDDDKAEHDHETENPETRMTEADRKTQRTRIAQARFRACELYRFANFAILQLHMVETFQVPTMAVDRYWRCYWNPAFVEDLTIDQIAGVILHEMNHLLFQHHRRAPTNLWQDQRRCFLWNIATDMAINEGLYHDGIRLPRGVVLPWASEGDFNEYVELRINLTAEQYFLLLDRNYPQGGGLPRMGQWGGFGNGSGSDGTRKPWEAPAPNPTDLLGGGSEGENDPNIVPGIPEADSAAIVNRLAKEAAMRGAGVGSAEWRKTCEVLVPKVDPFTRLSRILARVMRKVVGQDYTSYERPNRRQHCSLSPDVVMPSRHGVAPRVAMFIDTSGSMSDRDTALALGTVKRGLMAFKAMDGLRVYTGDTEPKSQSFIADPSKIELIGGGGTHMGRMIDYVDQDDDYDLIVILTDGITPWDTERIPKASVMACITQHNSLNVFPVPKFITAVVVEDPDRIPGDDEEDD